MKPRGLMVIHQFRPVIGGAELQAERLATKLVELGHPIEVFTQLRTPDTATEETINGVRIHRAGYQLAYWARRGATNTFAYLVRNRSRYDILHAHQMFGHAMVAVLVARCFRKKSIIKVACAGAYGDLSVFSRFEDSASGIRILRQADAVVAISREVEEELLHWGFPQERISRIPNGVDCEYFRRTRPLRREDKVRFLLIGRRHPQKGIDIALRAASLLQEEGLSGRFEIKSYGRDFEECDYREMARDQGVDGLVEFLPFQEQIREVMEDAHCLILPSRGEGLSNSLLESMAMELPVIATEVSGTVDVIDDGKDGMLIPPDSPEALANAMAVVIRNPDLAVRLGRAARLKVLNNFSLDAVAQRYSDLYCHLHNSGRG